MTSKRRGRRRARVLILEDDSFASGAMASFLGSQRDIEIVGICEVLDRARAETARLKPDVILIDVVFANVFDSDGIVEFERMRESMPSLKGIVVSNFCDEHLVRRAFRAGAVGYMRKSGLEELAKGIRKVCFEDDVAIDAGLQRYLVARADEKIELSERQREVLVRYAKGALIKEIANDLKVAESTVKDHVRQLKEKTGCSTKGELIVWAITNRVLRIGPHP